MAEKTAGITKEDGSQEPSTCWANEVLRLFDQIPQIPFPFDVNDLSDALRQDAANVYHGGFFYALLQMQAMTKHKIAAGNFRSMDGEPSDPRDLLLTGQNFYAEYLMSANMERQRQDPKATPTITVIGGEMGAGKTTLLAYAHRRAMWWGINSSICVHPSEVKRYAAEPNEIGTASGIAFAANLVTRPDEVLELVHQRVGTDKPVRVHFGEILHLFVNPDGSVKEQEFNGLMAELVNRYHASLVFDMLFTFATSRRQLLWPAMLDLTRQMAENGIQVKYLHMMAKNCFGPEFAPQVIPFQIRGGQVCSYDPRNQIIGVVPAASVRGLKEGDTPLYSVSADTWQRMATPYEGVMISPDSLLLIQDIREAGGQVRFPILAAVRPEIREELAFKWLGFPGEDTLKTRIFGPVLDP